MRVLFAGDTQALPVHVQTDGAPEIINTAATVKAALVSLGGEELAGPFTCLPSAGNWAAGIVSVPLAGVTTKDLRAQACRIEVRIEFGGESITRQCSETISLRRAGMSPT